MALRIVKGFNVNVRGMVKAITVLGILVVAAPCMGRRSVAKAGTQRSEGGCPKAVVLNFDMTSRVVERRDPCTREMQYTEKAVETEKDVRGWWFGSEDVWYNANTGKIAADIFDEALRNSGLFQVYSRQDLKYYYADKKEILTDKLNLAEKELEAAILKLDPVKVGRELGVDKVVTGRICSSETRHSRVWGFYNSATAFTVTVYDVKSGKVEFSRDYGEVKASSSQYLNYESNAKRFVRDLLAVYQAPASAVAGASR